MKNIIKSYEDFFSEIPRNIKFFFGVVLVSTIVSSSYNVLFGIYMKNIGFTEDIVGQILSTMTIGVALGAIPVAAFAQKYNKKNALLMGLILMFVSSLFMLNIKSILIIKIFSILFGVGQGTIMILQGPIIFENTENEHRVMAFSMVFVFQNIAFVISSFFLGHLSEFFSHSFGDLTGNLIVLNGATTLLLIGMFLVQKLGGNLVSSTNNDLSIVKNMSHVLSGYKYLLRGKSLMYITHIAFIGIGAGMIVPFFSIYLKYTLSATDGVVGNIMAISQIGTVIGGLIVPPLAKKIGNVKTIYLCQLLSIPFLLSISIPQGAAVMTISFFFRSSLMNMSGPIAGNLALEIVNDDERTNMSGLISLASNLFRAMGIFIGGYLMYKYNYHVPYYFTIGCYIVGVLIMAKTDWSAEIFTINPDKARKAN